MTENANVSPSRIAAARVLMETLEKGLPLSNLPGHPAFSSLGYQDRAFASEIVYGVLRNLLRCDYLIRGHSNTRFDRIDREVLWILRISLYQLEFMSSPDYAVVSDAVAMASCFRKSSAAGFINGLLRTFLRERVPLPAGNSVAGLAVRYSHPEWLVARYLARFGAKRARKMMAVNNKPPESYLRINPGRIGEDEFTDLLDREGIRWQDFPELPGCLKIFSRGFNRHHLYREGNCFYMDFGSQLIAFHVEAEPGMRVGDLCAAPGGKSFILADRTGPKGIVAASDISCSRLRQMQQRMIHYGIANCHLACADLEASLPPFSGLDSVLLDVPCSGLGTLSSNPEIRWLLREEDLLEHQARQAAILGNCFKSLRKGQKIYYSTCSSEPEENEEVVEALLRDEPSAELIGEPFNTIEDQLEGEGFFLAAIRKSQAG